MPATNKNTVLGCSNWCTNPQRNPVNNFYEKAIYNTENNSVSFCSNPLPNSALDSFPAQQFPKPVRAGAHNLSRLLAPQRDTCGLTAGAVSTQAPLCLC